MSPLTAKEHFLPVPMLRAFDLQFTCASWLRALCSGRLWAWRQPGWSAVDRSRSLQGAGLLLR